MGLITFVLKWVAIAIAIIIVLLIGIGFYLYNFHVFKTVVFCVSSNYTDTNVSCTSNANCSAMFQNVNSSLVSSETPGFIRGTAEQLINEAISCGEVTKTCQIRPFSSNLIEADRTCVAGEKEIQIKIRGKEGIQLMKFLGKNRDKLGLFG